MDSKHIDLYFEDGVCYNGEVNFWKKTHGFLKHVNENNVSTSFFFQVSKVNSTDKKIVTFFFLFFFFDLLTFYINKIFLESCIKLNTKVFNYSLQ